MKPNSEPAQAYFADGLRLAQALASLRASHLRRLSTVVQPKTTALTQEPGQHFVSSNLYPRRSIAHSFEKKLHVFTMSLSLYTPLKHHMHDAIPLKPVHAIVADDLRVF